MKRGLRITLILAFGLPLGFIMVIGLIAFADGNFGAAATDYYEGGRGYAVYRPEGNPDNAPAVLLVHEWWGLNEEHLVKARRLADEGYVVYSPDAYGGKLAKGVPGALFLTFTQDIEDIHGRIDRAYNAMLNDPMVDPDRTAVAGFCFGGRQAMMLGIRDSRPEATVTFYGSGLVTNPDLMGLLGDNGPVLGIFGEDDASIPLDEVAAFRSALESRGTDYREAIYPGVGHAFVKADNIDEGGAPTEAWNLFLEFLDSTL
jgi:carboxymethylenebutenolidase